jgi:hypothetical protein
LTQKQLKNLVTYNKDSGIFRWKNDDLKGGIKKGTVCGTDVPGERSRMVINIPSTPSLQPEPCVFLPLFCLFLFSS